MAANGRARVTELFTWPRKAQQVRRIYDWVLNEHAVKPSFFKAPSPEARQPDVRPRLPQSGAGFGDGTPAE